MVSLRGIHCEIHCEEGQGLRNDGNEDPMIPIGMDEMTGLVVVVVLESYAGTALLWFVKMIGGGMSDGEWTSKIGDQCVQRWDSCRQCSGWKTKFEIAAI